MNELTITLVQGNGKPLYEQIYEYLKNEIREGSLPSDERLPSTRALAKHLQVSRNTVDLAYDQLVSEGYIEAVPYKGYYVSHIEELYQLSDQQIIEPVCGQQSAKKIRYDFQPDGIELNAFPYNAWRKITKNTLIDDKKELFMLGSPMGEWSFRVTIARYLHQARGVNCTPEQIIVGAGNDYLLLLLGKILGENQVIAMENPTYKQAYKGFISMGYEVRTVGMDEYGMDVEDLECTGANIAYVMPSHQYPLGTVMPIKRRLELLKWALEKPGRYIIEDDYDSEFRYKGKPIPALQGNDGNDTVIYIGTFSKSIAPAIRVSYMVLPPKLLEQYQEKALFYTSTVSRIDQTILNVFITEGYYERHLNRMRAIYKSKHDVLLVEMKKLSSVCKVYGENAGLHILAEFHNGMTEEQLIRLAAEQGITVYGISQAYIAESKKKMYPTLILGYATISEQDIKEAVSILEKVWIPQKQ